jgi:hypothetical protein
MPRNSNIMYIVLHTLMRSYETSHRCWAIKWLMRKKVRELVDSFSWSSMGKPLLAHLRQFLHGFLFIYTKNYFPLPPLLRSLSSMARKERERAATQGTLSSKESKPWMSNAVPYLQNPATYSCFPSGDISPNSAVILYLDNLYLELYLTREGSHPVPCRLQSARPPLGGETSRGRVDSQNWGWERRQNKQWERLLSNHIVQYHNTKWLVNQPFEIILICKFNKPMNS